MLLGQPLSPVHGSPRRSAWGLTRRKAVVVVTSACILALLLGYEGVAFSRRLKEQRITAVRPARQASGCPPGRQSALWQWQLRPYLGAAGPTAAVHTCTLHRTDNISPEAHRQPQQLGAPWTRSLRSAGPA